MRLTQCLKRARQIGADETATADGTRLQTWRQVEARVAQLASSLRSLGLHDGDRIAILAVNSDKYLEVCFAVSWAGGIFVPLNCRLDSSEIGEILNDSGARILVLDDGFSSIVDELHKHVPRMEHTVLLGEGTPPPGTLVYEEIVEAASPVPDRSGGGEATAAIFYTSGTTGRPKGAMLTHANLLANAFNTLATFDTNPPFVYLHAAPMFHIADAGAIAAVTLRGGQHVFIPEFKPNRVFWAVETHGVTHLLLAPTMLGALTAAPGMENYDLSSLRVVVYGASPMPERVLRAGMDAFSTCEFVQGYGMTETSALITALEGRFHKPAAVARGLLASVGHPVVGAEVLIVDDQGREVPRGAVGEIITRGAHVMKGYWNRPAETQAALRNGWMHTGDVGFMNADGFVFIVDRKKDMIISGGENVSSLDVEQAVEKHEAVAKCAAVGKPSLEWGEAVHAVVLLKDGAVATEADIIAHCHQWLAGFKCPKSVEFRDRLPLSSVGKVLKHELKAGLRREGGPESIGSGE